MGSAQDLSGAGGEVICGPPVTVEEDAHGSYGLGAVIALAHARSLLTDPNRVFAGALHAPSVQEMFGAQIRVDAGGGKDWFVASGDGERSLGTIKVAEVLSVTTRRNRGEGLDMRLAFQDASGETCKLTIIDLLAQGYLAMRVGDGYTPQQMARAIRMALQRQRLLYLRIALAEPYESQPDRCYPRIAGIITGQTASQAHRESEGNGIQLM